MFEAGKEGLRLRLFLIESSQRLGWRIGSAESSVTVAVG